MEVEVASCICLPCWSVELLQHEAPFFSAATRRRAELYVDWHYPQTSLLDLNLFLDLNCLAL